MYYTFIAELIKLTQNAVPTKTHHFINKLNTDGRLQRCYTQNIDGLEVRLGLDNDLNAKSAKGKTKSQKKIYPPLVQLHGTLDHIKCALCHTTLPIETAHVEVYLEGHHVPCTMCVEKSQARVAAGRRPLGSGIMKPHIVLYNEAHPYGDCIGDIMTADLRKKPDSLIIMGTTLKVAGIKKLVRDFARSVRDKGGKVILVNKTDVGKEWDELIDYHIVGGADDWVKFIELEWARVAVIEKSKATFKARKGKMIQHNNARGILILLSHSRSSGNTKQRSTYYASISRSVTGTYCPGKSGQESIFGEAKAFDIIISCWSSSQKKHHNG